LSIKTIAVREKIYLVTPLQQMAFAPSNNLIDRRSVSTTHICCANM